MPTVKKGPAAKAAGDSTRVIDLAAARAARAEQKREPVILKWSDTITFQLPVEMPADFALQAQAGRLREAVSALIGEQAEEFFALRPSMEDLTSLAEIAGDVYGITSGEAPASAGS